MPEEQPKRSARPPQGDQNLRLAGARASSTVLVEKPRDQAYARRLAESIRFFEKAVDHPVKLDPKLLQKTFPAVRRAYLTPTVVIMGEDSDGKTISLSLKDLPADEALKIMTEAMRSLGGEPAR